MNTKKLHIQKELLPNHVAIIMDGNGRWAQKRLLPHGAGHRAGVEALRGVIRLSGELGIKALTLYAFSTENWKRSQDEVDGLMNLLIEYFESELDELHKNGVVLRTMGDLNALPDAVQKVILAAKTKMANNHGLIVNIAINYGAQSEIIACIHRIMQDIHDGVLKESELDETKFYDYLYSAGLPNVDFMIRTSGECRISNFMLYQLAYAELYFTDVLWPDFSEAVYMEALAQFQKRNRRFGGR